MGSLIQDKIEQIDKLENDISNKVETILDKSEAEFNHSKKKKIIENVCWVHAVVVNNRCKFDTISMEKASAMANKSRVSSSYNTLTDCFQVLSNNFKNIIDYSNDFVELSNDYIKAKQANLSKYETETKFLEALIEFEEMYQEVIQAFTACEPIIEEKSAEIDMQHNIASMKDDLSSTFDLSCKNFSSDNCELSTEYKAKVLKALEL